MKKRTYFGEIFIASSMLEEFLEPVLTSFYEYTITQKDDGKIISGTNFYFIKDNIEWGCFLDKDNSPVYFELGVRKWIYKPLLDYISRLGIKCVIAEQEDYLMEVNKKLIEFEDTFLEEIRKELIKIEKTIS